MYEVATREMPERTLLCLKRTIDEEGQLAFGKEFIATLRERPLPKVEGREGAFFSIHWGQVIADSDGPVEWCWPVPGAEAGALAERYLGLRLRTEPAHREAFVTLPVGPGGIPAAHFQLAAESLRAWEQEQGTGDERPTLKPEDLGLRITGFVATGSATEASVPEDHCDVAVPFA
jgi:hypothetical protein